jgi:predicted transcriptional regulator of viral defense system
MKYISFKEKLKELPIFSLSDIRIIAPKFHRNQLTEWMQKGYIKKIKKGFYFFSDCNVDDFFLNFAANKIYAPSYISMELALARYGFIPESVYGITSVSTRKTQTITSEISTFIYRNIKPSLWFGYQLEKNNFITCKIASPEKALLDFFYFNKTLQDFSAIEEMRFNIQEIQLKINWDICTNYLAVFQSNQLNKRFNLFKEYVLNA